MTLEKERWRHGATISVSGGDCAVDEIATVAGQAACTFSVHTNLSIMRLLRGKGVVASQRQSQAVESGSQVSAGGRNAHSSVLTGARLLERSARKRGQRQSPWITGGLLSLSGSCSYRGINCERQENCWPSMSVNISTGTGNSGGRVTYIEGYLRDAVRVRAYRGRALWPALFCGAIPRRKVGECASTG